jgi:hypothetical protein
MAERCVSSLGIKSSTSVEKRGKSLWDRNQLRTLDSDGSSDSSTVRTVIGKRGSSSAFLLSPHAKGHLAVKYIKCLTLGMN